MDHKLLTLRGGIAVAMVLLDYAIVQAQGGMRRWLVGLTAMQRSTA